MMQTQFRPEIRPTNDKWTSMRVHSDHFSSTFPMLAYLYKYMFQNYDLNPKNMKPTASGRKAEFNRRGQIQRVDN